MTSPYPCPFCGSAATLSTGCQGCGRAPDPEAAEVIRLGAEIVVLTGRADSTWRAHEAAVAALRATRGRRDALAARVRARVAEQAWSKSAGGPRAAGVGDTAGPTTRPGASPAAPAAAAGSGAPGWARPEIPAQAPAGVRPETSTRAIQAVLFVLGGLLLGTAAIVFTAVAWATFGVGGRAAILATLTGLALAAPLLALRRRLLGTAETFAAIGLLLVLLDGYAAWYVDLLGVAAGSATRYAAGVCAVTAGVAAGYGVLTGLVGPRFVTLAVAQPVIPLLAVAADPAPVGWCFVFVAVAAVNAAWTFAGSPVSLAQPALPGAPGDSGTAPRPWAGSHAARSALWAVAWLLYGGALLIALGAALTGLIQGDTPGSAALAGAALITVALTVLGGALISRRPVFHAVAGAVLVLAIAVATAQFFAVTWPARTAVLVAAVAATMALAVTAIGRVLPARVRIGPCAAALAVAAVPGLVAVAAVLGVAVTTAANAAPPFAAALPEPGGWHWQRPVTLALLTVAFVILLPARTRVDVGLAGGSLLVLAAPAVVPLPWWGPAALAVTAAAALVVLAVRTGDVRSLAPRAAAAAGLAGFALLAGLGRTASTAVVLGTLAAVGVLAAALAARGTGYQRAVGGGALLAGLLAWPGTVAAGFAAVRVEPWWVARSTVAAGALLIVPLALIVRDRSGGWWQYRWYAFPAALAGVFLSPVWAVAGRTDEPSAIYAAVALLLIAAAVAVVTPRVRDKTSPVGVRDARSAVGARDTTTVVAGGAVAAAVPGLWCVVAVLPTLVAVLVGPYGWFGEVWSGRPAGTGLTPYPDLTPQWSHAAAIGLVLAGVALLAWRLGGAGPAARVTIPAAMVLAPVVCAVATAPWPVVPAVSLLFGLSALLTVASAARPAPPATDAVPRTGWTLPLWTLAGLVLTGAGLAGALPTRWSTLGALGMCLAAAATAGVNGRTQAARVAGWLTAVVTGMLMAFTGALAAGAVPPVAGYAVLGAAALTLALGVLLRRWRMPAPGAGTAPPVPVESTAVEAAAHVGAVVALLLTIGSARHAAAICTLWGIAVGLRALLPGERAAYRRALVAVGAGSELLAWWLLMVAAEVALTEAYTLPAAAVGFLAGWLALRQRPALNSWRAYGPALAAALLPSLASVLGGGDHLVRRFLLGLGALAVLLLGAASRRQAPVVLGGLTLAGVALHELVLVWEAIPRWIPLGVAGLLLVGLAMTVERRRRDLARLRATVARMT